jgi:hypothetical protein
LQLAVMVAIHKLQLAVRKKSSKKTTGKNIGEIDTRGHIFSHVRPFYE